MDVEITVHSQAIVTMLDGFERKASYTQSTIGTLMGTSRDLSPGGGRVIDARAAYMVPYQLKEDEGEVIMHIPIAENMIDSHKLAYPNEYVVGWFLVGGGIEYPFTLVHEHYQKKCAVNPCIMLNVDITFITTKIEIKAYKLVKLHRKSEGKLGDMLIPIRCRVVSSLAEQAIISAIAYEEHSKPIDKPVSAAVTLSSTSDYCYSIDDLIRLLDRILEYIAAAVKNPNQSDPDIGRELVRILTSVSKLKDGGGEYQDILATLSQDMLTVQHLVQMAQTLVTIVDNINKLEPLSY